MIEIEGLTKCYGDFKAVDNINFKVNEGEVLGFLGPNGAGKTTTLRILTCFMPPTSGNIRVGGLDVLNNSIEIRKRIGYLPENTPLYTDLTVKEHLKYAADLRLIPSSDVTREMDRVAKICSIESVFYKPISILSKGFRQRVGLALALIHNPDILVLDEPTSGLDPRQIIEIRKLIKEIGKEKTIILSSHILPEVSATCDRVVIIHKGKITGQGTPEELQSGKEGEGMLITSIRGPQDDVLRSLEGLPGVKIIETPTRVSGDLYRYEIRVKQAENPAEHVFNKVRENNWTLTELYLKQISLEDIFMSLTLESEEETNQ